MSLRKKRSADEWRASQQTSISNMHHFVNHYGRQSTLMENPDVVVKWVSKKVVSISIA